MLFRSLGVPPALDGRAGGGGGARPGVVGTGLFTALRGGIAGTARVVLCRDSGDSLPLATVRDGILGTILLGGLAGPGFGGGTARFSAGTGRPGGGTGLAGGELAGDGTGLAGGEAIGGGTGLAGGDTGEVVGGGTGLAGGGTGDGTARAGALLGTLGGLPSVGGFPALVISKSSFHYYRTKITLPRRLQLGHSTRKQCSKLRGSTTATNCRSSRTRCRF